MTKILTTLLGKLVQVHENPQVTQVNTEKVREEGASSTPMTLGNWFKHLRWIGLLVWLVASFAAKAADQPPMRNFYEVLDDVIGDFEYDLKNGNVNGLKDLAIRNIAMSENVPPSFKSHLELLITEKIMKTSKTRVIQCLPCRAKKTTLNGDQVIISSNDNNPVELSRIAKMSGISDFMDVSFAYQPAGLILSMSISDPESGSIVWSRSYNSENSKAAAYRRGVDFSQVDDARKQTEYIPTIQYRATIYYLFEPDVSGTAGCVAGGVRMMERYDNRKKEVGFEMNYMMDSSTIVGGAAATGTVHLYQGFNLTLTFVHAWNFIGEEESFNKVRGSAFAAVGGTYTSGFLGGVIRGGYEWRLAKHNAVTAVLGYRPTATAFLGATAAGAVSGLEYGLGISYLF